ncbi:hypothetical protein [Nitrosospira lacus]|uniref:hypothetical protein n=1 Tax=Nitrosospira lacus TaxID=1288494 RepID=UPI0002C5379A|nr:hypothetical protein [Nitrosospira lacus]
MNVSGDSLPGSPYDGHTCTRLEASGSPDTASAETIFVDLDLDLDLDLELKLMHRQNLTDALSPSLAIV